MEKQAFSKIKEATMNLVALIIAYFTATVFGNWLTGILNIGLTKEVYALIGTIILYVVVIIVINLFRRKKPNLFTFENDKFAYYTIVARLGANYKKAGYSNEKWEPSKDKISDIKGTFAAIIPNNCKESALDKADTDKLVERFSKDMSKWKKFADDERCRKPNEYKDITAPEIFYTHAPFILVEHLVLFQYLNAKSK